MRFWNQITLILKTFFFPHNYFLLCNPQNWIIGSNTMNIWPKCFPKRLYHSSLWLIFNIKDSLHHIPYYFVFISIKLSWYSRRTLTNSVWGHLVYLHIQCPFIYVKLPFLSWYSRIMKGMKRPVSQFKIVIFNSAFHIWTAITRKEKFCFHVS